MEQLVQNSVCIVGAGAMGMLVGYYLDKAGANVTYLVRPHRSEALSKQQKIYSYDDSSVTIFDRYKVITELDKLSNEKFQFIVITLDGASLRAEAGLKLIAELGKLYKNTNTGIILGSAGINERSWFTEHSGLSQEQVINGLIGSLVYDTSKVQFTMHPGINQESLDEATYAHKSLSPFGFIVDDSSEVITKDFVALFNKNDEKECGVMPADDFRLQFTSFPVIMAWELLGWKNLMEITAENEIWILGVDAMKELQALSQFGKKGEKSNLKTNAEDVLITYRQMNELSLPLDFTEFMKYHHGAKVNFQDHEILREALRMGHAENRPMPALNRLVSMLQK